MAEFTVTVEGKDYDVTAPDERTAWAWANATHRQSRTPKPRIESPDPSEGGLPFRPFGVETGLTMPQGLSRFAAGGGKAFTDIARGAGQMVGMGPSREEMTQIQAQDRPLMSTGAGTAGNIAGGIAAAVPTMAIPGVNTYTGLGALGGAMGALRPVTGDESRLANIGEGAALGVAIPGAIQGTGKAGRMVKNVIDPWLPGGINRAVGRTASAAAGSEKQAIVKALRNPQQIVPGSLPSAGEAAAPVGRAEFSGLQEVIKGRAPTAYENIGQAQNAARVKALRGVGQDKAALEAAVKRRASEAALNYGAAEKQLLKSDETLKVLMERPSMDSVLSRAKDLAKEQGKSFKFGKDVPEEVISGKIVSESGQPLTQQVLPAKSAEFPVESLHYIKMAMDDLIKNPERFGIGASEARAISATQKQFVEWLGSKSSAYEAARTAYAAQSKPINQMEVGQYLEGKLVPALNDLGASSSQRAAAYAQALRDAPGTLKRATGQPRYDELGKVLEPGQLQTVTNVGSDLARSAIHERLAKAGTEKARELVGQVAPKVPAAGMFSPQYSVMRAIINRLEGKVEGKSLDKLAESMQPGNLSKLADAMEGLAPKEKAAIAKLLREIRPPLVGGTVYGIEEGQNQ